MRFRINRAATPQITVFTIHQLKIPALGTSLLDLLMSSRVSSPCIVPNAT